MVVVHVGWGVVGHGHVDVGDAGAVGEILHRANAGVDLSGPGVFGWGEVGFLYEVVDVLNEDCRAERLVWIAVLPADLPSPAASPLPAWRQWQ